jgi:hypothetical protein
MSNKFSVYLLCALCNNCVYLYSGTVYDGVATSLVYDADTRSLYVAGTFQLVNGQPCSRYIRIFSIQMISIV